MSKLRDDLAQSHIDWRVIVFILPIAFLTYVFHEFGHWTLGEALGNEMMMTLNSSYPRNGRFMDKTGELWSAIGGPMFTIIQALLFMLITWKTKSIIGYTVVFFAAFSRFFSLVFGGLARQDEAGIARLLGVSEYLVASAVLAILFLILWRCHRMMKLDGKALGYFTVLGVSAILVVIGVYRVV